MLPSDLERIFEQKRLTFIHLEVIDLLIDIYKAGLTWLEDESDSQSLMDALQELHNL